MNINTDLNAGGWPEDSDAPRFAASRRAVQESVQDALTSPDAETTVDDGAWAGFSRGEARAWCEALFAYEPHGFVSPGSMVRAQALRLLENGGLPEVFDYPARAAALASRGLNPETYRQVQEQLGRRTFFPQDVTFRR
ncbi:hypothetical protein [uncultured Microbacterium sp.]|uniref:hypothetical protein n=1 Tax=uncultured Microbacterium sp. TaxID=191216 RepID=UPI0026108227|nr:hypothetical protein [uncultured Microbacterium sp.]